MSGSQVKAMNKRFNVTDLDQLVKTSVQFKSELDDELAEAKEKFKVLTLDYSKRLIIILLLHAD